MDATPVIDIGSRLELFVDEFLVERMQEEGFFAGLPLVRLAPELAPAGAKAERVILVAVTEKRTRAELDRYVDSMKRILK